MRRLILVAVLALAGCAGGTEYRAGGTREAPRAQLEVTMDDHTVAGNYPISVEIDRLPPAWDIDDDYTRFAVWAIPRGEQKPMLAGFLDYDRDARSGRLETVTPFDALTIIVTAEGPDTPLTPSDAVIAGRAIEHHG